MMFSCSRPDHAVIHIYTYGNTHDYTSGLTSSEYINTIIKIIVIIIISDCCSFYKITHVASEEIRQKKIIQSDFFFILGTWPDQCQRRVQTPVKHFKDFYKNS